MIYDVDKLPQSIAIGYTGEKKFRPVVIDMKKWMDETPEGVPSIIHIRPGETEEDAYIAVTTFDGRYLTWLIDDVDLGTVHGSGIAQVWLEKSANDSVIKRGKSAIFATVIKHSVNSADSTPSTPQAAVIEQMTAIKDATVLSASAANASATTSGEKALVSEGFANGKQNGTPVGDTSPYYHNNSEYFKEQSATKASESAASAVTSGDKALISEGFANGKQNGTEVGSTSPYYQNNSEYFKEQSKDYSEQAEDSAEEAQGYAEDSEDSAEDSEAYAVGKRGGIDVGESDPTYENNSKHFSEVSAEYAESALESRLAAQDAALIAQAAAAEEVGDWLSEHVNPSTGYVVDDTLSVENAAADSATVGEKVAQINSDIQTLSVPFNEMVGTISNGNPSTSGLVLCSLNFNYGTYTEVAEGKRVCTTDFIGTDVIAVEVASSSFRLGVFIYSRSTGAFIQQLSWLTSYKTFDHSQYKYRIFGRTQPDGNTSVADIAAGLMFYKDTPSGSATPVVEALKRKNASGTSIVIANASKGKVLACTGESSAKVEPLNLCSVKDVVAHGRIRVYLAIGTLEAGTYTLTAECVTDNPNITKCRFYISGTSGSALGTIKCDGTRDSKTVTLSSTITNASIYFYASTTDQPADYTGYTATFSNIVLARGIDAHTYEPYSDPVTYSASELSEMKLTEHTNIITSATSLNVTYLVRSNYVDSIQSGVGFELTPLNLHYVSPEMFGALGDGVRNDATEVNACITYALSKGLCVRGYGNYKVESPVVINGDNANIELNNIEYTGSDYAVQFQGVWGQLRVNKIVSSGGGLLIHGTTAHTKFDTFYVGQIKAAMHGVRFRLNGAWDCFGHVFSFDEIRAGRQYYCIYIKKEQDATTGNMNEIKLNGGYVWDGLWGIVGNLGNSVQINVHTENLGSDGNGGAIWSMGGTFPRLLYARFGEIVNHNTAIKISGTFVKSSVGEANLRLTLPSIDITELEPDSAINMSSDNAVLDTQLHVQKVMQSSRLLTHALRLWGNRFQFPQLKKYFYTVSADLDMTDQYYDGIIPYRFIADGDVRVDLHTSYVANCINEFEVQWAEGDSIVLYDFLGTKIFDSADYVPGIYKLTAYIDDGNPLHWELTNQKWDVTTISVAEQIESEEE